MRRKPYRDQVLAERGDILVAEPQQYYGRWQELLNCQKLHIEIGSGKGDYWWQMAQQYPQDGWIAIERNLNIAAIALRKLPQLTLNNARYIAKDSQDLATWFAANELDFIHLNFVDPWPKKAHSKRRLTHPQFLEIYHRLLRPQGQVWLKTDNEGLWEFSLASFKEANFELLSAEEDLQHDGQTPDVISEYEAKFIAANVKIKRAVWQVKK